MPQSSSSSSTSPYAACVNPPRGAKQRARSPSESSSSASEYIPEPRLSPKLTKAATTTMGDEQPSTGAKRGRKPATLSRTAREAQRKLNHSIIEKARRTKINDALATLKTLVPLNYGQQPPAPEEEGEDGEDEAGKKGSKKGKKEEKEKEFKLEILVRTVSFMQDLIARVAALEEANKALSCAQPSTAAKRKRDVAEDEAPAPKRVELDAHSSPSVHAYSGERLPSISSWLPSLESTTRASPVALMPTRASPEFQSHLPSPPSSTQFPPARAPAVMPPALNLGPIATQALLSARTPEDESAASLLLEISASSPTFREQPRPGPMQAEARATQMQIQTPASLLGLK
ncbi:hypothetical protein C8R45DRAFT_138152 [Mycena sanguinolenta]|nr:hypothetical protein C8R45DRAFT_138152 [Mycena sanguinolenta]